MATHPARAPSTLSLILCSRNDNYMGNSLWRLQTTLNLTADHATEAGVAERITIVVTDWGSEEKLATALQLTPAAAAMTRFLEVSAEIATAVQGDSPFSEVHALNAAARRCSGDYIGRIDQDTVVGTGFFRWFATIDASATPSAFANSLYFSQRREVPRAFTIQDRPAAEIGELLLRQRRFFRPRIRPARVPFWSCGVGVWLMHREVWHKAGGYDEAFIYRNEMEVEMAIRLKSHHPLINLGELVDHDFFHLGHEAVGEGIAGRKTHSPIWDRPEVVTERFPNPANWGLADRNLPTVQVRATLPLRETNRSIIGWSLGCWVIHFAQVASALFVKITMVDTLFQGRGFAGWSNALMNRLRLHNFQRHWRKLRSWWRP